MKTIASIPRSIGFVLLLFLSTLIPQLSTVYAQGTAFTYQGRLNSGTNAASGTYNLTFSLFATNTGGSAIAGPMTNNSVGVTNGLFTVTVDFGTGLFTGTNYWLQIGVETNGASPFTTLTPRQQVTPTPYAIYAESVSASNIIGTVSNTQLKNSDITLDVSPGLSGGGKVNLGNTIILTNTGVLSVTGDANITATTVNGAVTLSDTSTSLDAPNALVARDGGGNLSAATIALDGNLNLPAPTATAGIIYSGGNTLIHAYGTENFFAGPAAGNLTMTGFDNTANGYGALATNMHGSLNTANGAYALSANTGGNQNTANGFAALSANTIGFGNTANGSGALELNTNGSGNTADGYSALLNNTSGSDNTANGYSALFANTIGFRNTANGAYALSANTGGNQNTANGFAALSANTTGSYNTANGSGALNSNTNGSGNTANGYNALTLNTSGSDNTANGRAALFNNTDGAHNTADGVQALNGNTDGSGNIALGYQAGFSITTGNNNIDIYDGGAAGDNGVIRIGTPGIQTKTFIAGISGVTISPSGGAVYVNAHGQLGTVNSSRRFKEAIQDMAGQSDILLSLRPVSFHYKPDLDPQLTPQYGLIAEEVEQVAPQLVLRDAQGEVLSVRYEQINAMLLNEFQKDHRKVEEQSAEMQDWNQKLNEKDREIAALKDRLAALETAVKSLAEKK